MTQSFTCPQGHLWQGAATVPPVCPQCGHRGQAPVPSVEATALSLQPAGQVQPPPTVAIDGIRIEDSRDRTQLGDAGGAPASLAPTAPGYEVLAELGRGGMGVVYKARHTRLNRIVALKMILAGAHASYQELMRFRAEAEAVALLQHPNIVQIYEVGEHENRPFFSLEFIEGGSLAERLDGTPQPSRWAAELIQTLARAIQFAHQRGIVHRDLKPANVLLSGGGWGSDSAVKNIGLSSSASTMQAPSATPKITDFGLAKRLEGSDAQTKTGAILGTPSYIAPEQAAGRKDVGPPVDVYALGAILYEMLTGRPPFRGETSMDTMLQVMADDPVPPCRLQPKVPIDLETICLKCLEKDPKKRYATADALADDLRRFRENEPIEARPISLPARAVKWARRRPAVAALIAVSTLAALALLVGGWLTTVALGRAYTLAEQRADEAEMQRQVALARTREVERERAEALNARQLAMEKVQLARRSLYALQLTQVAALAPRDPARALQLLDDADRCPPELRDFTWDYLHRLSDRQRATLTSPKTPVACVVYSPDGKLLASAGGDDVVLWDTATLKPKPLPARHGGAVVALAFSSDAQLVATAGLDKIIRLWDPNTAKEVGALDGHEDGVRSLAFAPDGKTLASASHDGTVRLWDVAGRVERAKLKGHRGAVTSVSFAPDGKLLASGGADKTVRLWDTEMAKQIGDALEGHDGPVLCVAFAPHARMLASGSSDGQVKLWDLDGRKEPLTLAGHIGAVNAVSFAPDGRLLASASADRTIKLWQSATGEERTSLRGAEQTLLSVAFAPNGEVLTASGMEATIRLWNVLPAAAPLKIELGRTETHGPTMAFAPDARALVTVDYPGKMIRLWDLATARDRQVVPNLATTVDQVAVSPDGRTLAAAAEDHTIKLYDLANGRLRSMLKGTTERFSSLAFAPEGQTLASGDRQGRLKLWDLTTAKETLNLVIGKSPVRSVLFASDGKTLAVCDDVRVSLWNTATRNELVSPGAIGPADVVAFAPDGRSLALTTAKDHTVRLWDVEAGQVRRTFPGPGGEVRAVAFYPDGQLIATGHADGSVRLWDTATGQERAVLTGMTRPIHVLRFTDDGQTLIAVGTEGQIQRWQAAPRVR